MICSRCTQDLPDDQFGPSAKQWPRQRTCHACNRNAVQIKRHGLDAEARAVIAAAQGGCAICGHPEPGSKGWVVDHDRSCCPGDSSCPKCRRGIVCQWCNAVLGFAFERAETLRGALTYLEAAADQERGCAWHMPVACAERICGKHEVDASETLVHARNARTEALTHSLQTASATLQAVTHARTKP